MTLAAKQARFIDEYLVDLNATEAAKRAGYSDSTAYSQGSRLLKKVEVVKALELAKNARSEKTRVDAEWVLRRLAAEANADIADLFDGNGKLKPAQEWPEIWRKGLVQGVEVEQLFDGRGGDRKSVGQVVKIKLDSRIKRIELIGKHVGVNAFQENICHQAVEGLGARLERAHKRLNQRERATTHDK